MRPLFSSKHKSQALNSRIPALAWAQKIFEQYVWVRIAAFPYILYFRNRNMPVLPIAQTAGQHGKYGFESQHLAIFLKLSFRFWLLMIAFIDFEQKNSQNPGPNQLEFITLKTSVHLFQNQKQFISERAQFYILSNTNTLASTSIFILFLYTNKKEHICKVTYLTNRASWRYDTFHITISFPYLPSFF